MRKIADLPQYGDGIAIYEVHLDECIERDLNARVMNPGDFLRLKENIKTDQRLESLPYGHLKELNGRIIFEIISGHHRTRAANQIDQAVIRVGEIGATDGVYIFPDSKRLFHQEFDGTSG